MGTCAMILAAGRGERMRPLTDTVPKPLLVVRGKPLIVHHIEKLVAAGVTRIVINVSYLAHKIKAEIGDGSRFGCEIFYSYEPELLETGGGVATASALFSNAQLLLASADVYSDIDYKQIIDRAQNYLGDDKLSWLHDLNAHFVMVPRRADQPGGEFAIDENSMVSEGEPRHTTANVVLLKTELVKAWPRGERFALLPIYRQWVAARRVSGELFTGTWCNVTTVSDIEALNRN
jgi:N-acetyl-alpha-D-muramate 1-phosphate uridylyltransferase